ncbi:MAG: transcription-repair coupling factor [Candidatus Eisenbacteria bacterium]|nr:transcription-repair coupling factor [Candidatus Eisenbacteria bacterium]
MDRRRRNRRRRRPCFPSRPRALARFPLSGAGASDRRDVPCETARRREAWGRSGGLMPGRRIVERALESGPVPDVVRRVADGGTRLWVSGLLGSSKTLLAAALAREDGRAWVVMAPNASDAEHAHDDLVTFLGPGRVQFYGEWETLPYERRSPLASITETRLVTLSRLTRGEPIVVVTTPKAAMQTTLPRHVLADVTRTIRRGDEVDLENVTRSLVDLGYRRVRIVEDSGDFSVRGGIVDVLPFGYDDPIRVELFGDTVESVRQFDTYTQRSISDLDEATILPRREVVLQEEGAGELAERLRKIHPADSTDRDHLLAGLDTRFYFEGVEQYLPTIHPDAETLADYLPEDAGAFLIREEEIHDRAEQLSLEAATIYSERRQEMPLCDPDSLLVPFEGVRSKMARRALVTTGLVQSGRIEGLERIHVESHLQESFASNLELLRGRLQQLARDNRVIIMCDNAGQAARLSELLEETAGVVEMEVGSLERGFSLPASRLVVYTDHDIFQRYRRRRRRRIRGGAPLASFEALSQGDYVVHVSHGIGRYVGIERVEADGRLIDCVVVEYADEGRVYVPADELDRLQKYVGKEGHVPRLNKLGTPAWQKTKERAREAAEKLARELLELYASRRARPGHAFGPDNVWQQELEASFIYEETDDQLRATEEIKEDLESSRPMDRLICGDVGFGKTEVAIRAAFKVVMDGKQVAVLVPTTILAQQHLTTFRDRLAEYPVRVDVISRFRTAGEQKEILERLKDGKVDIIIGTHRLIQKDVEFSDLGLLVIDEEQQFGVLHKEAIQRLKQSVDVLTMTATPIPRTLHMSLMGARDMSIIATPPRDRLPVRTEISPFDDELITEAVMREIDRGGQVYFVHNRVQTIEAMASYLRNLLPELRIEIGHGQMPERQLEDVMFRFLDGEIDVLVCSMIIESGLDIPNVNTIIVNRADRFGLAQLYQLRGRVGRSNHRAYCYLLIPRDMNITPIARRRLAAIQEFTDLSSGYKLAMRDLEIRGAGNVLGAEQHGHMMAVGFNLYARLLRDAVARIKDGAVPEEAEATVHIKVDAYIPNDYIPDNDMKIDIYKRIRDTREVEPVDGLAEELRDRFGPPPQEVLALLDVQAIRILARETGLRRVELAGGSVECEFAESREPTPGAIRAVLSACTEPLEFDARGALVFRFPAPSTRRGALETARRVLSDFIDALHRSSLHSKARKRTRQRERRKQRDPDSNEAKGAQA